MSLKNELSSISEDTVTSAYLGHSFKLEGLRKSGGPNAVDSELMPRYDFYPGVAAYPTILRGLLLSEGMEEEKVDLICVGASMAMHTLIEIAESQEIPSP